MEYEWIRQYIYKILRTEFLYLFLQNVLYINIMGGGKRKSVTFINCDNGNRDMIILEHH